jgi:glycosyltransferase involved in cell wall biosynthesis
MGPLVSCVMVTRPLPHRLPLVRRSVECYLTQSYPHKELVVALDAGDEADKDRLAGYLADLGRSDVRVVRASDTPTLGRLRNFAIESARGELVSVWDDDDLHHPERVRAQVAALHDSGAAGTFLTEVLHLFVATGDLYWTNYRNTVQKCLPGTGLFRRDVAARYPEIGPDCQRGEDTSFCLRLMAEGTVHFVDDAAQLYIYVNHGNNTSGDDHHHMLARSLGISRARLARREATVREALEQAALALDEVRVHGNNGLAFSWRRGERPGTSPPAAVSPGPPPR